MAVTPSGPVRDLDDHLTSALASLSLGATASQRQRTLAYVSLLERWNAVHNLSAARGTTELLQQHVIDCLAVVPSFSRYAAGRSLRVLDAGTGAGLPAVVLAIMRPGWDVTAVDSVGKKVAFVRQVAGELGLTNLHPRQDRLECIPDAAGCFDVVTARAFASLRQLVEATRHLIAPHGVWAAMKSRPSQAELTDLPADCQMFHVERLAVPGMAAERCLVWIKPVDRIGAH